jgi:serine protease Do
MKASFKKYLPLVVIAIISSVITSIVVVSYGFPERKGDTAAAVTPIVASSYSGNLPSIADVAETVGPAVVRIDTERVVSYRSPFPDDGFFGPFFRDFFGGERIQPGTGSGFIISPDGYVVTNYHVVEESRKVEVTLTDGRKFTARVVNGNKDADVAVIKIKANNLPVAQLGDSSKLRQGDWVVAIGNPYGFDHSVTAGVVSAVGRRIDDENGGTLATGDLIQTDAAINSGNSGGPLINMEGKVIGINTAIIPYAQGLGFAISINSVKDTLKDIVNYDEGPTPWIGIWYQQLDDDIAKQLGLSDANGILVTNVIQDSPAEKAGLKEGDVIKEIDGKQITAKMSLAEEISKKKVGDKVVMYVLRGGQKHYLTVVLGEYPGDTLMLK